MENISAINKIVLFFLSEGKCVFVVFLCPISVTISHTQKPSAFVIIGGTTCIAAT